MKLLKIVSAAMLLILSGSAFCQTIEIMNPSEGDFVSIEGFTISARAKDVNHQIIAIYVGVANEFWQGRAFALVEYCPRNEYWGYMMNVLTPDIYASTTCDITQKNFPIVAKSGDLSYWDSVIPGETLIVQVTIDTIRGSYQDRVYVIAE